MTSTTPTISECDLAYAAGIIDGEGCIKVSRIKPKHGGWSFRYNFQVSVDMVDVVVPRWLHEKFGGSLAPHARLNPLHRKSLRWILGYQKARPFLESVLPHLKIKRPHVENALWFLSLGRGSPEKATAYQNSRKLNSRGASSK